MSSQTIFMKKIEEVKFAEGKELNLTGTRVSRNLPPLTHIPEQVFELEHLETLKIAHHKLEDIPQSIIRLRNLKN